VFFGDYVSYTIAFLSALPVRYVNTDIKFINLMVVNLLCLNIFLSLYDVLCLFTVGVVGHCYVWSHATRHTSHSVGLICTRDGPVAEISNWQDIDSHVHAKFEPATPASQRPQNHALDRAVIDIDCTYLNINTDKYRDFLCNTTVHFYCNTATCCGLPQKHHQVIEVS